MEAAVGLLAGRTTSEKHTVSLVCEVAWIAVWSTEHSCVKMFRMKGLPFGGTASVASFLRMSRALKELGIPGPLLVWSSSFDDFIWICLTSAVLVQSLWLGFVGRPRQRRGFSAELFSPWSTF
jgi:hypothetical protein